MTDLQRESSTMFFRIALEYYINGRSSLLSGLMFTTGSLFHHAVEMLLKGELVKTVSLDELKQKYGHSLPKCWAAFKALFPSEDLTEFDPMIAGLDRFEHIRYPNTIVGEGAGISFGWGRSTPTTGGATPTPEYRLFVGDVDALFDRVIRLCPMTPRAFVPLLSDEGRAILFKNNDFTKEWMR
jgi:hypothetical protein